MSPKGVWIFAVIVSICLSPVLSSDCQGDSKKALKASASSDECVCMKNAFTIGAYSNGAGTNVMAASYVTCFPNGIVIGRNGTSFSGRNLNFCPTSDQVYSARWKGTFGTASVGACAVQSAIGSGDGNTKTLDKNYNDACALPGKRLGQLLAAIFNAGFDKCGNTAACTRLLFKDLIVDSKAATPCTGYKMGDIIDYAHYVASNAKACPGTAGIACSLAGIPSGLCSSTIEPMGDCFGKLFGGFETAGGINGYNNDLAEAVCSISPPSATPTRSAPIPTPTRSAPAP
eukprot:CAMPEP_0184664320 /NCGR_PEP_ID=MMETSP0308-20130426/52195_1 /TAXON_ID=38269 /ORGANISM="Gloeochaete witrockiana, Strain SAG 46.84" /LENGTH=286 /DNA_ID=CAMNT_0027107627 /DNA_START=154 /DNA_END=1011 /DNA_ORIENTATION=-